MPATRKLPTELDAVIVGAGFSGLYQLYKLRNLGMHVKVVEAGSDIGGTWYWNRYPGARCDVESMHYSYSFDPELEQEWEWTEKYPSQPEILSYIHHVADRHDLRRDVVLDTKVTAAHYDEDSALWTVRTEAGEEVSARYCIMAVGCLSVPKKPEVPGLERFRGDWYHTCDWPESGVDFTGKRVAVIGTGSSGIQAVPIIAKQADALTVFQRTPNFSLPTFNGPIDQDMVADIKSRYREIREESRQSGFGVAIEPPTRSALEVDPDERHRNYEERWQRGNLTGVLQAYTDLLADEEANETAAEFVRGKIREIVDDPETAEKLCPKTYAFGTKRPCLDTGYYETFNSDHVELVDLRETPLVEITDSGVRTSDREYEVDSLVLATGFDAMTGALLNIDIRGRGGQPLREKWQDGPALYLGLNPAGFPNLFTITGPGSPSVLSNMIVSIEQHVEWITDLVEHMRHRELRTVEATETAEKEWTDHVREVGDMTLYPQTDSWYMGANVPGKPRLLMAYLGGVGPYWQKCQEVAANDYEGFALSA
ncbi:cyclohexanone monooxygenase [Prauserella aidingensis]|uniref:flavin-containing monooxygenase n=1 Tax=Prauserella aidingensis TaxID=387890 RepID=UPI0020A45231|nr:NAD(P)/FAD-dependent oxidoreductase [Prauserella aidingensis]MCP2252641.1 cyclohexanone monooxygenase [Prauserella aidingensis]